jgi:hypothetical protein
MAVLRATEGQGCRHIVATEDGESRGARRTEPFPSLPCQPACLRPDAFWNEFRAGLLRLATLSASADAINTNKTKGKTMMIVVERHHQRHWWHYLLPILLLLFFTRRHGEFGRTADFVRAIELGAFLSIFTIHGKAQK